MESRREALNLGSGGGGRARGRAFVVVAGGTLVVLLLVIGAYVLLGMKAGGDERQYAERALQQVVRDARPIDDTLLYPDLPSVSGPSADNLPQYKVMYVQGKATLDAEVATYQRGAAMTGADLTRLRAISGELETALRDPRWSPASPWSEQVRRALLLPQHGALRQERGRIDLLTDAFSAAVRFLKTGEGELKVMSAMYDALSALVDVLAAVGDQHDLDRALALSPPMQSKVQQAVTLSQGTDMAPEIKRWIGAQVTYTTGYVEFLRAAKAGNQRTITAARSKALDALPGTRLDETAFSHYRNDTLVPLLATYHRDLSRAGVRLS